MGPTNQPHQSLTDCFDAVRQNGTSSVASAVALTVAAVPEGLPLVEIAQRALFFTPPLLQTENLVLEKKLRHDGNPVMTWMVSNLVVKVSKFNELRHPTKERPENKIDGPVAMLMALGRAMTEQTELVIGSDYEMLSV